MKYILFSIFLLSTTAYSMDNNPGSIQTGSRTKQQEKENQRANNTIQSISTTQYSPKEQLKRGLATKRQPAPKAWESHPTYIATLATHSQILALLEACNNPILRKNEIKQSQWHINKIKAEIISLSPKEERLK